MPNLLTLKRNNQVVCNADDSVGIEEHTNENGQTKIGLKSKESNIFFFYYSDLTLENANIYTDTSHDLPEDFESYKYCYTPDDGFTLYPKYVVSEVLEDTFNPLDYEEGEAYPAPSDNFGRTVTYQDGSKTIISATGEVTQVDAP